MNSLSLILENTLRGFASSDGRISLATQTTLLFFLLTLTLTSASIQSYLSGNLDQMLGSDLVVESRALLQTSEEARLRALADRVSVTQLSELTITHQQRWERIQLKLVDDMYPLQGDVQIGKAPAGEQNAARKGPEIGEIWLESRLATQLNVKVGDSISIGDAILRITAILFHEPDRILEGHSTTLRAMAHADSFAGGAVETSNARFRYLIAADATQEQAIQAWAKEVLPGISTISRSEGQHPLASFWQRAENFLGLASVILFFMGAVAIDMTNRRWLARMRYRTAIYASFGTPKPTALLIALGEWLLCFILSVFLATTLAAFAYVLIVTELQAHFPGVSAAWHVIPASKTIGLLFLLLLALQLPSFFQLTRASLLSLIRNPGEDTHAWQRASWGVGSVTLLAAAYSDNWILTAMTLAAVLVSLLLMAGMTWSIIRLGDILGRRQNGLIPFAFFMMRRRLLSKSAQVIGLGLCGLLLLFSLMLMRDLGRTLEDFNRSHDGNLMIAEAQADQIDAIEDWANTTGSSLRAMRPFVSAQLVAINGRGLVGYSDKPSDTLATLRDPIRLTWTNDIPDNNKLVGGKWWPSGTAAWQQVSAEEEVITDLGLRFGDKLTYQIAGKPYVFTLVASHAYQSGGGSITFWFQVPIAARDEIDAPVRYMGSMELPPSAWKSLSDLLRQHPTMAIVPLKELTERFDQTLGVVAQVTSGYAAMIMLLTLFVIAASVAGFSADDRRRNGLLMSMGLRASDCQRLNLIEWLVTALIASAGSVVGTWVAGVLIYEAQFKLSYDPSAAWLTVVVIAMVAGVCLIGFVVGRQNLKVSVRDLLAN